jgi:hypothetical protein
MSELPPSKLACAQRPSPGAFRFSAHAKQKAIAWRIAMPPQISAKVGMSILTAPQAESTDRDHKRNHAFAAAQAVSPKNTKSSRLTVTRQIKYDSTDYLKPAATSCHSLFVARWSSCCFTSSWSPGASARPLPWRPIRT